MANISVEYGQLESTAKSLIAGKTEMEAELKRLKGLVDGLITSGFKTDMASGKFGQSYQDWMAGATRMLSGLDGMQDFLNRAAAQHRDLDQQLSQGLNHS